MRRNEVVNVCGYRRRQRTVWCMSVEEGLPEGSGCVCRLPRAAAGVGSRGSGGLLRMRQPGAVRATRSSSFSCAVVRKVSGVQDVVIE
ncbi:hypothetical protein AAHA92_01033 [Salvia divinorum]|uniref:Uncharacterized protein n=1 Tax=Salvia divinorum TaxID=28513 RepID=A0ABD1IM65_SALDI